MFELKDIINNGELKYVPSIINNLFQDIKDRYKQNNKIIDQCNRKTQDLLHEMEFLNYDVCKGYKLYKEMQETRQVRRKAKNENELLKPAYEYIKTVQGFESKLDKIQRETAMISCNQEIRQYRPKVKKEAEELFAGRHFEVI